jgi:hypothetical protein
MIHPDAATNGAHFHSPSDWDAIRATVYRWWVARFRALRRVVRQDAAESGSAIKLAFAGKLVR